MAQLEIPVVPELCSLGPRPWIVTGFLVGWMRYHFSAEDQLEDADLKKDLRGRLWKATLANSGMLIESITSWKPSKTETRPSILVARNDWHIRRLGINDQLMGGFPKDGGQHFSVALQGSHTLFCLAPKGPAAEILAMEVCRELFQFGPIIRWQLNLLRFTVVGAGKLFLVEESQSHYAVPVTVAYECEDNWVIHRQAPFLKSFKLSMFVP